MKADEELVRYIKKRFESSKKREDEYSNNSDDSFKKIYHMGESSAFREIIMILEEFYD